MQKVLDLWELFHCREILPWQMNNTFIIVLFLLDLPRNALFCKGFRGYCEMCDLGGILAK